MPFLGSTMFGTHTELLRNIAMPSFTVCYNGAITIAQEGSMAGEHDMRTFRRKDLG